MKTRTQRGPGQAETEAETRVMLPAAKEHLGLPEREEAGEPPEGAWPCQLLDFTVV